MKKGAALLIIDVQNDFCPRGTLPVPAGDLVVEPLSQVAALFAAAGLPVLASRDWHPAITGHFIEYGGSWPRHCVQGSSGAAFHPELQLPPGCLVISKGFDAASDGYSAFDGRLEDGRSMQQLLADLEVTQLYVGGLATDYCVKETVLAAVRSGIKVTVLEDAIAGVDLHPGDSLRAIETMKFAGVYFTTLSAVVEKL